MSSISLPGAGSLFRLCWSSDGRLSLGGTGTGKLIRIDVGGIEVEDETHALLQTAPRRIEITEVFFFWNKKYRSLKEILGRKQCS